MNKMIKGSVAGATGIALLMGGFGTYALWSDSESLAANGVQSGELSIDTAAGQYDDVNSAAANDWTATDKLVPGDTVSYTQSFTVKGTGKNLKGTLALAPAAMAPNGFSSALTRTVEVTSDNTDVSRNSDKTSFTFNKPFGSATLTAVVTYTFPGSVTGSSDQNKSASTPVSTFTITQS